MKKLIPIVFFLLATRAFAELIYIGENSFGDSLYLDKSTVQKEPSPRAWVLIDYSTPSRSGARSSLTLYEADCLERSVRDLAVRLYSKRMGDGYMDSINGDGKWSYAAPHTIGWGIFKALCEKNKKSQMP